MSRKLKFDRARFDAGEMPARTRNGRKVLKVVDSGLDIPFPLVAWIEGIGGNCPVINCTGSGMCYPNHEDGFDLVHEPKTRTVQVMLAWFSKKRRSTYSLSSDSVGRDFRAELARAKEEGRLIKEWSEEVEEPGEEVEA